MASFTWEGTDISEPDSAGKRHFITYLRAANYNAATIAVGSSFLPWQYGKNMKIRSIHAFYEGTVGAIVYGYIQMDSGDRGRIGLPQKQITSVTYDGWIWETDVDLLLRNQSNALWIYLATVGYGATDSMDLSISGEVW